MKRQIKYKMEPVENFQDCCLCILRFENFKLKKTAQESNKCKFMTCKVKIVISSTSSDNIQS